MKKPLSYITLLIILLTASLIWIPEFYHNITRPGSSLDYITAALFLVPAYYMIKSSLRAPKVTIKVMFILAGIIFLLIAGNEINWFNGIFDFDFPIQFPLILLDDENPSHVLSTFYHGLLLVLFAVILLSMISYILRKRRLYNLPVMPPTIFKSFSLCAFYVEYQGQYIDFNTALIPGLLMVLFTEIRSRKYRNMNESLAVLILIAMLMTVHSLAGFNFPDPYRGAYEVRTLLYAVATISYASYIYYRAEGYSEDI